MYVKGNILGKSIMITHYQGKVKNSNLIRTKVCCFNSLPNKQENFTSNKTLRSALIYKFDKCCLVLCLYIRSPTTDLC